MQSERRPIRSRETRWAQAAARGLVRIGVSPNAISLFGMGAASAGGICLFCTSPTEGFAQRGLWLCAAALCQVRLLCNLFDGMVALVNGAGSSVGELFNEVPDRVSDAAIFIGLGYAAGGQPAMGFVAAILAVFTAYVRAMARALGAPNDFCGPMAKPQRMALTTLLCVYLAAMPAAWRLPWSEVRLTLVVLIAGMTVTALRRLLRAARHLRSRAA